ncbi:MAG: hypothetical protein M3N98_14105 [Actinomycetota bacterium]|nr:hypothetical protein [Actinomycetota bacterium]
MAVVFWSPETSRDDEQLAKVAAGVAGVYHFTEGGGGEICPFGQSLPFSVIFSRG